MLTQPLVVAPPSPELVSSVRLRLRKRWMPGDWFQFDDRVEGHYAWKAAVMLSAVRALDSMGVVPLIEIGTRAGYSLQAFAEGAMKFNAKLNALCFDAYLDPDSDATWAHFATMNDRGPGIDDSALVVVNTAHVQNIPNGPFAHVDGEHTAAGVYRDLELVRWSSVILADDCDNADVMDGVRAWLARRPEYRAEFIDDGLRTLGVLSRAPERGRNGPKG